MYCVVPVIYSCAVECLPRYHHSLPPACHDGHGMHALVDEELSLSQ